MSHKKVAVIIAGGKSSRMQKDKALLPFGGYASLAEYQYRRLSKIFSKVYLSSKENKFDFEVEIIEDIESVSSPLVALVSIFETLEIDEVFVLSVDAPFVTQAIIEKLYTEKNETFDVIVAKSSHGIEPLCAIYQRTFLPKAKIALKENQHRLQRLLAKLEVKEIEFKASKYFMNLNYPNEYEEAKKLLPN